MFKVYETELAGRKLTIDELKELLSAYEKLENYKNLISKEINIKY